MELRNLPKGWEATRRSLQLYAQAVTAFPRAGAPHDPRWSHVAMDPTDRGFSAAPVPLDDGTNLRSELDLIDHLIVATAGDDVRRFSLRDGPAPRFVGESIAELTAAHGSRVAADPARYDDDSPQHYDVPAAEAFAAAARIAVGAMRSVVSGIDGEVSGPHLWPHGFDIATEWFSTKTVEYQGSDTNAQIGIGWYPTEASYVYVSPWPFADEFTEADLPAGATWHREGWEGARLPIPPGGSVAVDDVVSVGSAVFDLAIPVLKA